MALQFTRLITKRNQGSTYDRIIHVCLWLILFLVPFFFLPFTTDPLEFNKALLFYLLVLIAGVAWLMKLVVRREGAFQRTPFDILLAIFALFSLIAAFFSLYQYRSFVGVSGYYSGSFVSLVFFIFFFYLVANTVRKEHIPRFINAFFLSGAVLALFNFFQVFAFHLFPWDFTKVISFNALANSPATFSIYIAILTILCVYRFLALLQRNNHRFLERGLLALLGVVGFFLLFVYDQPFGWFALMLGLLLYVVLLTAYSRNYSSIALILPTVLIGLSLISLFVNTQAVLKANLPGDILLPPNVGTRVAFSSFKANPLIGFGQETYQAVFAKFRPLDFNNTAIWDLRFLKSSNEWFQQVSSVGILGTLAFFALCALSVRNLFRVMLKTAIDDPSWWERLSILAVGLVVVLATFVLPFNFILSFFFWLFLALGVVLWREKDLPPANTRQLKNNGSSFVASLGFSLSVVLGIVLLYFAGRFWIADMKVTQASRAVNSQEDLTKVQALLADSLSLNPYEQSTYFSLAQNLLVQTQLDSQKEDSDPNTLRSLLAASIAAAQTGANKFSNDAGTQEALSQLYQSIDIFTETSNEETKKTFDAAIALEPNNPRLHMNLGQYYLAVARVKLTKASAANAEKPDEKLTKESQEAIASAQAAFEAASKLKENYLDAKLNLALSLRLQNKGAEAVTMLEELVSINPFSVDALFNLAENYLIDKKTTEAEAVLKRVVSIFPGHSDSHFRLAQIYEERNEDQKAIDELEIVKKINPDNEDVQKKLDELKGSTE